MTTTQPPHDLLICGLDGPGVSPPVNDLLQQLHDLAVRLNAEGMDPLDLTTEVGRLNAQLGSPVKAVVEIVRQLPGLEAFDVMDAWARRWNDPVYVAAEDARYRASEWYQTQLRRQAAPPPPSIEDRRRTATVNRIIDVLRGQEAEVFELFRSLVRDEAREVLATELPECLAVLREGV